MKEPMILEDIPLSDSVFIILLRAEIAKGLILSVQYPEIPEGFGVLTAVDIPGEQNFEINGQQIPFFCTDEVLYEGQPFALIFGPSEKILYRLKEEVYVTYHENASWSLTISPEPEQIVAEKTLRQDFSDKDLLDSTTVLESTFHIPEREAISSEPYGAIAVTEENGLRIYTNSRWASLVRDNCAAISGFPKRLIHVETGEMNQASEGKLWYPALLSSYAALVTRTIEKPAKILITRQEERIYISPGIKAVTQIQTGLDKDSNIHAIKVLTCLDCGYLPVFGEEILKRTLISSLGLYKFPKVFIKILLLKTNSPPTENTSSMGLHPSFFSIEHHAFQLSEHCKTTPDIWKIQNLAENFFLTSGSPWPKDEIISLIRETADRSDFRRKFSAYEIQKKQRDHRIPSRLASRGIGIAITNQGSVFFGRCEEESSFAVRMRLTTEGKLHLYTTISPADRDTQGIWRKITAELLSLPVEDILVSDSPDEPQTDSGPNFLSRNTTVITKLIEQCATAIAKRRFRDPLPLEVKRSYRGKRTNRWNRETWQGDPYQELSWGTAVVEIELEPVILKPVIRGIWGTFKCGQILNPERMRQTVITRMEDTLNWTYQWRENLYHTNGHGYTYDNQLFPLPDLVFVNDKTPPKGIGGLCDPLFSAAYINAIAQASGCSPESLPLTPKMLHRQMEEL